MSLITTQQFREDNGLPSNRPTNAQIDTALLFAENELRNWIGDSLYDSIPGTLTEPEPDPKELLKAKIIKGAEAKLTWYFLLPEANIHVSDYGILLAADGNQEFGGSTIRVARPDEILKLKNTLFQDAWKAVSKFIAKTNVLPVSA